MVVTCVLRHDGCSLAALVMSEARHYGSVGEQTTPVFGATSRAGTSASEGGERSAALADGDGADVQLPESTVEVVR